MAAKKKAKGLTKAMLETAADMRRAGVLDRGTYEKITMRHLGSHALPEHRAALRQIGAVRKRAS